MPQRGNQWVLTLGTAGEFLVVEVTLRDAVTVARADAKHAIRARKTRDADADVVKEQSYHADNQQPVQIAPFDRTITVAVSLTEAEVKSWPKGQIVFFPWAGDRATWHLDEFNRRYTRRPKHISANFVRIEEPDGTQVLISVRVGHDDALLLLEAIEQSPFEVVTPQVLEQEKMARRESCYIRHRRGEEVTSIPIPCKD